MLAEMGKTERLAYLRDIDCHSCLLNIRMLDEEARDLRAERQRLQAEAARQARDRLVFDVVLACAA